MKRHKRQAKHANSTECSLVQIEKPIYGGAFLARLEGKAVFVPLTLPGEQVRVRITEDRRGYAVAEAEEILTAAPERVVPHCPHFGTCGGCHYQHTDYDSQLRLKLAILRETLERGGVRLPEQIDLLSGNPWGYRNRIRLGFDASGDVGYRGRRSHTLLPISECPIAAPLLVKAGLTAAEVFRQFKTELQMKEIALFCDAEEAALLATLFTMGRAKVQPEEFGRALSERIPALRGVEFVAEDHAGQYTNSFARWGEPSLAYRAGGVDYRVDNGAFFQVNRWLVDALLERVTAGKSGKLAWDLFAGVGLFARQLSENFVRLVAVESEPMATAALEQNLLGSTGTAFKAETLAFLRSQNTTKRPDLIVVDPPRIGLGAETSALLGDIAAPAMVYVSCDPATLARDLRALIGTGYAIESITLADLFPQTFHIETVVHLCRS